MVFRERAEKVANVRAMTKIVATLFNVNEDKVFGPITREYAKEVFQESYDAELLRKKIAALYRAQELIKEKQDERSRLMKRLDRMGEFYEKK